MNGKRKLIVGVLALLVVMTMGYALFSETVTIGGTAKADGNLSVIFDDIDMSKVDISAGIKINKLELTGGNKKLSIDVSMDYPGADIYIPVTIRNNGNVNAFVKGISLKNIINLDVTDWSEDLFISFGDDYSWEDIRNFKGTKLLSGESKNMVIYIWWNDAYSNSKVDPSLDFVIELDVEQLANNYLTPFEEDFPTSGKYAVGSKFCLQNECFNIIKDNGTSVDALASYSLANNLSIPVKQTNSNTIVVDYRVAMADKDVNKKPTEKYGYWTDDNGDLLPIYGTNYPAEIFPPKNNESNNIEKYFIKYKEYLQNQSYTINNIRLISATELLELGCDFSNKSCTESSYSKWIINGQHYFTGTAEAGDKLYAVNTKGKLVSPPSYGMLGIRPVITIDKSEIR